MEGSQTRHSRRWCWDDDSWAFTTYVTSVDAIVICRKSFASVASFRSKMYLYWDTSLFCGPKALRVESEYFRLLQGRAVRKFPPPWWARWKLKDIVILLCGIWPNASAICQTFSGLDEFDSQLNEQSMWIDWVYALYDSKDNFIDVMLYILGKMIAVARHDLFTQGVEQSCNCHNYPWLFPRHLLPNTDSLAMSSRLTENEATLWIVCRLRCQPS